MLLYDGTGLTAARLSVLDRLEWQSPTGCEAFYAVSGDAWEIKSVCVSIEDSSALGRLFDMDVLAADGRKLVREEVGGGPRDRVPQPAHSPADNSQGKDSSLMGVRSSGGAERAKTAAAWCEALLKRSPLPAMEEIVELDQKFIHENLSPGGCADLLAAAFFLRSCPVSEKKL